MKDNTLAKRIKDSIDEFDTIKDKKVMDYHNFVSDIKHIYKSEEMNTEEKELADFISEWVFAQKGKVECRGRVFYTGNVWLVRLSLMRGIMFNDNYILNKTPRLLELVGKYYGRRGM